MNNSTQRIGYVDRLKGMTILTVVVGHVYLLCYGNTEALMFRVIGSFHMYLFLFLSGMIIPPPSYSKVMERTIRYLLPSIIIGTITNLLIFGTGNIDNWWFYFTRRLYWLASGYWYLVALTVFNISLLLHKLNKSNSIVIDILLATIWYIVFLGLWKWGGGVGAALCMEHCTCFYPFFILGHLLRKYDFIDRFSTDGRLFSICMVTGSFLFFFPIGLHLADNIINRFIIPFCAIVVLVNVFRRTEDRSTMVERLFTFFGKNSLDIYLWHFVILYNIHLGAVYSWSLNTGNMYIEILLAFVLSTIVAATCVYWGKLIKQSTFIKNIAYGEIAKKTR